MISVVIPFYNEEKTLPILHQELEQEFAKLRYPYELIFINDGSTDRSKEEVEEFKRQSKKQYENIVLISHDRKRGKGAALFSGIQVSKGDTIIFMDADLQNDPKDIGKFLKKIEAGYDFVNGVREKRKDSGLIKMYSSAANRFLRNILKSPFTDINCGFKAIKRKVFDDIVLYSNNFRFLPIAAYLRGFKVAEIVVSHRARVHGKSKFGANKIFIGFFDMLTAYFIYLFSERPLHFFGPVGGSIFLIGFFLSLYLAIQRIFFGVLLFRRPALLLGLLLIIVGIQIVMTGIIGELIVYLSKKNSKL